MTKYEAKVNVNGQTVIVIGEDAQDLANGVEKACEVVESIQEQGKTIDVLVGAGGKGLPTVAMAMGTNEAKASCPCPYPRCPWDCPYEDEDDEWDDIESPNIANVHNLNAIGDIINRILNG